jgi:nucleoside-diphosphate-sugar epimerase
VNVFVAGASGVLGVRVIPLLVAEGHEVTGMTRSPAKADLLRSIGAEPAICDVYDLPRLKEEVSAARTDAIVHLLTDLPDEPSSSDAVARANARMRREGTANLLTAAREAAATRVIAQSVAWELPGDAGRAVVVLERAVLHVGGVVVRLGRLYGPGTWDEGEPPAPPAVHVDEAARRIAAALDDRSGTYVVADRA